MLRTARSRFNILFSCTITDFTITVGVDHVDDGDGEVDPDGEAERVAQEAHEREGVARAPCR